MCVCVCVCVLGLGFVMGLCDRGGRLRNKIGGRRRWRRSAEELSGKLRLDSSSNIEGRSNAGE